MRRFWSASHGSRQPVHGAHAVHHVPAELSARTPELCHGPGNMYPVMADRGDGVPELLHGSGFAYHCGFPAMHGLRCAVAVMRIEVHGLRVALHVLRLMLHVFRNRPLIPSHGSYRLRAMMHVMPGLSHTLLQVYPMFLMEDHGGAQLSHGAPHARIRVRMSHQRTGLASARMRQAHHCM